MTIRFLLEKAVREQPNRSALKYFRKGAWQSRTYQEFAAGIAEMGEAFSRLGLQARNDRAALILENGPEWMEAYLALTGIGIEVVPIDPKLREEEIAYVLKDSGAVLALAMPSHRDLLAAIVGGLPELKRIVMVSADPAADEKYEAIGAVPVVAYEALRVGVKGIEPKAYLTYTVNPQDVASIIYTSGTTGKPKGAMLTHNNFYSDAVGCWELESHISGLDRAVGVFADYRDDFMIVLPLFHSFAFTTNLVVPILCCGGMMFIQSLRTIGSDIQVLKPTVIMAVPLLVEKLLEKVNEKLESNRLAQFLLRVGLGKLVGRKVISGFGGRLRCFIVGGAPSPVHVLKGFQRLGIPVMEGYGLTECSPVVSVNPAKNPRIGSIGRPLENISVRIADQNAQGVGELQVRGPIVMKGYFHNPEATREAFDGDWLRTGDLAVMEDGYITICGRKKALIVNREGKNIYPEEVENVIARNSLIKDVVVIGYTVGNVKGERVGAIVTPDMDAFTAANGGVEPPWKDIVAKVHRIVAEQGQELAEYKHIRKLVVQREPLERTSIQKVRRVKYQGSLNE